MINVHMPEGTQPGMKLPVIAVGTSFSSLTTKRTC